MSRYEQVLDQLPHRVETKLQNIFLFDEAILNKELERIRDRLQINISRTCRTIKHKRAAVSFMSEKTIYLYGPHLVIRAGAVIAATVESVKAIRAQGYSMREVAKYMH